ncbi:MAG: helix-turn-helix transcriptional regulator [Bacteroidales bacterium]
MQDVSEAISTLNIRRLDRKNKLFADQDHYHILWIEQGIKSLMADVQEAPFFPNSIIFLLPGKRLRLRFACDPPKGWVLQFSREFFRNQYLEGLNINHADLFMVGNQLPSIVLSPKIGQRVHSLAEMIAEVLQSQIPNREQAASALLKSMLVYCDSSCNIRVSHHSNSHHLRMVSAFKHQVSRHFHEKHHVADYAEMLNVSPKYLNQVVKTVMGVTAKSIIAEQILIQACRDLKFSNESIKEIALNLGFSEPEHFSNFFKKSTGGSPSDYRLG